MKIAYRFVLRPRCRQIADRARPLGRRSGTSAGYFVPTPWPRRRCTIVNMLIVTAMMLVLTAACSSGPDGGGELPDGAGAGGASGDDAGSGGAAGGGAAGVDDAGGIAVTDGGDGGSAGMAAGASGEDGAVGARGGEGGADAGEAGEGGSAGTLGGQGGVAGIGGMGGVGGDPDPCAAVDCDDENDCTEDWCLAGVCHHRNEDSSGVRCNDGFFDGQCYPTEGTCIVQCGNTDQPCCEDECRPGLECRDGPTGASCKPCGGEEEPCCGGNTCENGMLFCGQRYVGGAMMVHDYCHVCGALDQPCCNETSEGGPLTLTCDTGLRCGITSGPDGTGTKCSA